MSGRGGARGPARIAGLWSAGIGLARRRRVLVHEVALVAAGSRVPEADGGILVHALEPATGEVRWSRRIDDAKHGVCDPLVTDGENVHLMDQRISTSTGETTRVEGFDWLVSASRAGMGIRFPEGVPLSARCEDWFA